MVLVWQVPYRWLALIDVLEELKKRDVKVMSLAAMEELGRSVQLPSQGLTVAEEITLILHYFTDLGLVSWFPDPALCGTVILVSPPLNFFSHSGPSADIISYPPLACLYVWCSAPTG